MNGDEKLLRSIFRSDHSCHQALRRLLSVIHSITRRLANKRHSWQLLICPHSGDEEFHVSDAGIVGSVTAIDQFWMILDFCAISRGNLTTLTQIPNRSCDLDAAWGALNDEICQFERSCGRQYTAFLINGDPAEPIMMAVNGIPIVDGQAGPIGLLSRALAARQQEPT